MAAERAEKEIAERANERCLKEISKLRADNAALTARVKEYETGLVDFHREMSALEAKLAEAEKALEHLTLHANSLALADIDRTRGRTGFWKALKEARAALGGKPS
ncbi:hypothetical protein BRY73_03030 [Ochrobactrum sp. P6BS-III]|nr:hypothetical protein BRY73_03030 [Ochrobactrum sp. P6BS-III]